MQSIMAASILLLALNISVTSEWMNIKMLNSNGNKQSFKNACSRHDKRNFKKQGLDKRENTSQKA